MGNDMRFNVSQLLKEGVGTRRSFPLNETLEALPDTGTTRVQGEVLITCIDKGVWVSGPVEANASSLCGRCLTQVDHKVSFHLDEEYSPTVDIDSGASISVIEEVGDSTFTIDHNHILDLTEAVRQYIVINLPMKPLCVDSCAGLCSTCGVNLNLCQCDCRKLTDTRWGPLLDLLGSKRDK
jgi:uncharacterized protein